MAFNNGFPMTYQQMYTPYQPQVTQNSSGIIWVSGLAGAKSFMVAPNASVVLFDSEAQCVYIKSADASGMPSIKVLDYTIRDQQAVQTPFSQPADYATKEEIGDLRAEIERLKAQMKGAKNESTVQRNAE